jgi:hypothetical protein
MPDEMYAALDQLWVNLLLTIGLSVTLAGVIAIALCALGGCLDAAHRRQAEKSQRRRIARLRQPDGVSELNGSQPVIYTYRSPVKSIEVSDGEIFPPLYDDTTQISEWPRLHRGSGLH